MKTPYPFQTPAPANPTANRAADSDFGSAAGSDIGSGSGPLADIRISSHPRPARPAFRHPALPPAPRPTLLRARALLLFLTFATASLCPAQRPPRTVIPGPSATQPGADNISPARPAAPPSATSPALEVEDDADIRPLRPALPPPPRPFFSTTTILFLLILLAVAAGLFFWLRHRFRPPILIPTPEEQARESLRLIDAERETLPPAELAAQCADVVRTFIAGNFHVAAPARTTEEFLRHISTSSHTRLAPHREFLQDFLTTCDKAKFAAASFDPIQRFALLESAARFVQATSYTPPPSPHPAPAEADAAPAPAQSPTATAQSPTAPVQSPTGATAPP